MRTNKNNLPWVCPACDCSTHIDPTAPEFYCSEACISEATYAVSRLLAPPAKASRFLVKHIHRFHQQRNETPESDLHDSLVEQWACEFTDELEKAAKKKDRYLSAESLVLTWSSIYYGGQA
ncbi:hypothetical protein D3C72_724440 [compost metagenome]